jgi:hypothetical protein
MAILEKASDMFNTIPMKISLPFCTKTESQSQNAYGKTTDLE